MLATAEAPSAPVALWQREALPDHRLHHQLQQAGGFWDLQLCHSIEVRVRPAHQSQLAGGDPGVGSSQPPPVHPEVAHKLRGVVPAHSGV
ncbi:hypothetical protein F7725_002889 [Dissostichus mawsoni]|uniref:Uncharacterized protein n=1 Tax=Dissostichus mawsoni TaxID=36200 RepID=A0A7J5YA08_DISMA|nr:hypothetical protein F7725_002889 [Dissostichus mawsoni]